MKKLSFIVTLFILMGAAVNNLNAQEATKPRVSPLEVITMKFEDTYIKITYGRPHKNGREIFGTLVNYNEVWRTGANEATEITVTKPIKIGGKNLDAGTYSIFSIPQKDKWTIILNSELGQWGAYKYNKEEDVARFDVPVISNPMIYEPFTMEFEQKQNTTNLLIMWDKTKVSIPIEF